MPIQFDRKISIDGVAVILAAVASFAVPLAASNHYFQVLLPGTDASIPVKITFSP